MADIARHSQFSIFFRKIGYSVGLEKTLSRTITLTKAYALHKSLSVQLWNNLIENEFELKTAHITDFFTALGLIRGQNASIEVMPNLEALAICYENLNGDPILFEKAAKAILTLLILEADGEIFLNYLKSDFSDECFRSSLTRVIYYKRSILFGFFSQQKIKSLLSRIINIERQKSNKGSQGMGLNNLSKVRRSEPLTKRTQPLNQDSIKSVEISNDYVKKVSVTRRKWAEEIGLFHKQTGISQLGEKLLDALDASGCKNSESDFILWPTKHEIIKLNISPNDAKDFSIDNWCLLKSVFKAFSDYHEIENKQVSSERVITDLQENYNIYRKLGGAKAKLKKEFPIRIAFLSYLGTNLARGKSIIDIESILDDTSNNSYEIRGSKLSIAAIVFRK